MEYDDIEAIVNSVARIALEGIVERSYTQAERERLEHAALTGEWRPMPPLGALAAWCLSGGRLARGRSVYWVRLNGFGVPSDRALA